MTTPIPISPQVSEIEARFVMTVYHDRTQVKKLRLVGLEAYHSAEARKIAGQLLSGTPVLAPIAGVSPLTPAEMNEAAAMISDYHLLRRTLTHGRALFENSARGDAEGVRRLLADPVRTTSSSVGNDMGASMTKYIHQVAKGNPFPQLDPPLAEYMPLAPGGIYTIAGMPGGGKTAWAESICLEQSYKGMVVADVAVELTEEVKASRYAQHLMGPSVGMGAHAGGRVDTVALAEAARRLNANTNLKLITGITRLQDIKDAITHQALENGLQLAVIDYIQYVSVPGTRGIYERLEAVTDELKELGQTLGIAQIWLAQFSKEGRKGITRPTMASLEGTSRIEQLSWSIGILDPKPDAPGATHRDIDLYWDKTRHAPTGRMSARLQGSYYDFTVEGQKPLLERLPAAVTPRPVLI